MAGKIRELEAQASYAQQENYKILVKHIGNYKYNGLPIKNKKHPGLTLFVKGDHTKVYIIDSETGFALTVFSDRTNFRYPIDLDVLEKAFEKI